MHVDELDKIRTALMEHAASFFHEVRTPVDVYERFKLCYDTLREEMTKANAEGRISPSMAEAWSWYSLAVPAMLAVIFQDPKWGTRQLELDLNDAFVRSLRGSSTTTINKPEGTPAGKFGAEVTPPGEPQPPPEILKPH